MATTSKQFGEIERDLSVADGNGWQWLEVDTDIIHAILDDARELPLVASELAHSQTCLSASQRQLAKAMGELTRCREVLRSVQANGAGRTCPYCEQWPHTAECELKELL